MNDSAIWDTIVRIAVSNTGANRRLPEHRACSLFGSLGQQLGRQRLILSGRENKSFNSKLSLPNLGCTAKVVREDKKVQEANFPVAIEVPVGECGVDLFAKVVGQCKEVQEVYFAILIRVTV